MSKFKVGQTLDVIVESVDENGKPKFKVITEATDTDKPKKAPRKILIKDILDDPAYKDLLSSKAGQELMKKFETDLEILAKRKD